jgi:hypothetical protein
MYCMCAYCERCDGRIASESFRRCAGVVFDSTVAANASCPLAWAMALVAADADPATTEIGPVTDPATGNVGSEDDGSVEVSRRGIHPGSRMRIR